MTAPQTMFEKIWRRHIVVDRDDGYTLLYIDRHLLHDGSAGGFGKLREMGRKLRRPDRAFATPDHYTSTEAANTAVIRDPGPFRFPNDSDVIGTVVARSKAEARTIAERLHGAGVLVMRSSLWSSKTDQCAEGCP